MQIIWYGGSCFKIISSELSVLTDPFSPVSHGFRNPRLTSEIILFSNSSVLKKKEEEKNNFFLIATPGEYEIKNIFIFGLPYFENNVLKIIYKMEIEGIKICFFGEVFERPVNEELEKLGEIDILFVPFIGYQPSKEIAGTIKEIPPKIIVPYFLKIKEDKLKSKIIDKFIKEIGWQKFERTAKLKIRKKDFSLEKTRLIVLEPTVN